MRERFDVRGAHVAFHRHAIGNDVHEVAARIDDRVEAHAVGFAEGFANGVHAHNAHHRGVESVDALVGRSRRVGGLAAVFDELPDKAVRRAAANEPPVGVVGRVDVHLHRHVDVVERSFVNQLLFAAEVADLPGVAQPVAVVDFDILFGGHRKDDDVAVQVLHRARVFERHRDRKHVRDLHVVPAAVRGPRHGVGIRVIAADDRVEFAEHRDGTARGTALHARFDARDGPAVRVLETELVESCLHLGRRFHFLVAEFGFGEDVGGHGLKFGPAFAKRAGDPLFEFVFGHSCRVRSHFFRCASPPPMQ